MADEPPPTRIEIDSPAGTILFGQGEPGGSMYVIRSGRVRLTRTADGIRRLVATLGPGEFFGEMAVVSGLPRSATAEVIEDAELIRIEANTLEELVSNEAEVAFRLIQRLTERLDTANKLVDALMHDDPHQRVIITLRNELELGGKPELSLDAKGLAARLGLSAKEANRALNRLARVGVIDREKGSTVIKDAERLEAFLEFVQDLEPAGARP